MIYFISSHHHMPNQFRDVSSKPRQVLLRPPVQSENSMTANFFSLGLELIIHIAMCRFQPRIIVMLPRTVPVSTPQKQKPLQTENVYVSYTIQKLAGPQI